MTLSKETPEPLRAESLPENVWNLRIVILLSMITAFGIELYSRYVRLTGANSALTSKTLSLVSLFLLCASALYLIFLLQGKHTLKTMVSLATFSLFTAQILSILREFPVWTRSVPGINEWSGTVEGPLLLAGIVLLLTTFYIALLETVSVKSLLRKQQVELYQEIAERERVQAELRESRDQLRQLSAHVESIRESERARMSREIHDELGQTLTSLKIDLDTLKRRMPVSAETSSSCYEIIDSMKAQIASTVQTTRRLMTELHPAILDDLGLQAAVEWLVFDFNRRTGIRCTLDADTEHATIGAEQATALYRIVQECLTNITRHANASECKVRLLAEDHTVSLEVRDNGSGIADETNNKEGRKFGILGMKERLMLLGGSLQIQSAPKQGTRVVVSIPQGIRLDRPKVMGDLT
jgi:signal transduction histidine kinase